MRLAHVHLHTRLPGEFPRAELAPYVTVVPGVVTLDTQRRRETLLAAPAGEIEGVVRFRRVPLQVVRGFELPVARHADEGFPRRVAAVNRRHVVGIPAHREADPGALRAPVDVDFPFPLTRGRIAQIVVPVDRQAVFRFKGRAARVAYVF